MEDAVGIREINQWILRLRKPAGKGPHPVILLLHGWTGDENSMWIFAPRLPDNALLIAPRGLYSADTSGFGWHPNISKSWPNVEDFRPAIDALLDLLVPTNFPGADLSNFKLLGFSQGTALVYAMTLLYPERIAGLAGLSGFLPVGAEDLFNARLLHGKPVFIAHGTKDELVPVEKARQAVELFERVGADISYCEDDVGHKLSLSCFRGLEAFFAKH